MLTPGGLMSTIAVLATLDPRVERFLATAVRPALAGSRRRRESSMLYLTVSHKPAWRSELLGCGLDIASTRAVCRYRLKTALDADGATVPFTPPGGPAPKKASLL
jgi:hypothetical protein